MNPFVRLMFAGEPDAWLIWDAFAVTGISNGSQIPYASVLDQSGNGRNALGEHFSGGGGGTGPVTYATNGLGTGYPSFRHPGRAMYEVPSPNGILSQAEFFLVAKVDTDPPGNNGISPHWRLGTSSVGLSGGTNHPGFTHTSGNIFDDAGSSANHTVGNPTPSLTTKRLYNVISTPSEWTANLDTTQLFTTATNTVAFPTGSDCTLGGTFDSGFIVNGIEGHIGEFRIYATKRTGTERGIIEQELKTKWGLTGY